MLNSRTTVITAHSRRSSSVFGLSDKSLAKIGEMIHDADLDDARFQRVEAVGIDRVLKGWAKEGLPDEEILRRGFQCFDALLAFLQRR